MQSSDTVHQDIDLGKIKLYFFTIRTILSLLLFIQKYKRKLEQQFAQIKEESTAQLWAIQHWEEWWKRSIQKIKQLYR